MIFSIKLYYTGSTSTFMLPTEKFKSFLSNYQVICYSKKKKKKKNFMLSEKKQNEYWLLKILYEFWQAKILAPK